MSKKKNKSTDKQVLRMVKMFEKEGHSATHIGTKFGISCVTVLKRLREKGVDIDLHNRKRKTLSFTGKATKAIVRRYNSGKGETTVQIAKDYQCSYATIRKLLKEENSFCPEAGPYNKIHFTAKEQKRILKLYTEVDSANAISKIMKCSDSVILKFLQSRGIDTSLANSGMKPSLTPAEVGLGKLCRRLTSRIFRNHKYTLDPKNKGRSLDRHLDHRLSLTEGICHHNLTIFDLAHPCNLKIITSYANQAKYTSSSIGKQELLNNIKDWNKEHGDPFESISSSALRIGYAYKWGRYKYTEATKGFNL